MSWAGSHRDFETVSLFFDSSPLEAASATDRKLSLFCPFLQGFLGKGWAHWENFQSPLLPRRKPKRRWVLQPFYPPFNEKSSIPGECGGQRIATHWPHRVCMCEVAILFFALNIYQSQAQARQGTVCVCVCVCVGGAGRGQLIPLILINSLQLSNTCHGVCTGLLLGDK